MIQLYKSNKIKITFVLFNFFHPHVDNKIMIILYIFFTLNNKKNHVSVVAYFFFHFKLHSRTKIVYFALITIQRNHELDL